MQADIVLSLAASILAQYTLFYRLHFPVCCASGSGSGDCILYILMDKFFCYRNTPNTGFRGSIRFRIILNITVIGKINRISKIII